MRGCKCYLPQRHTVHAQVCGHCRKLLDPAWTDSDVNWRELRTMLEAVPMISGPALDHAAARLASGREEFGFHYLARNNAAEALEELADVIVYMFLELLRERRLGVEDPDPQLLKAAQAAAELHGQLERKARWGKGWAGEVQRLRDLYVR